ncbi:DUF6636 domain-containing protein [Calothrix sp. NIES-2098]|uniref:DUF6636 domain-containing protein n=1 Tax=Calothrix sp. NIES-2098 TaxID=1954171 RepID=UPI000B61CC95|nr:hypothetical protein NIES2098_44450 [Calothrix sp. NIES-2098]
MWLKILKVQRILLPSVFLTVGITSVSYAQTVPESFVTPSGNIRCTVVGENNDTLRCDIRSGLNPKPPQPYANYCEYDWGGGFLLSEYGKPEILCVSDTFDANYKLSYGSTWQKSGFNCVSQKTGLTCINASGDGFFLSRESWKILSSDR